MMDCSGTQTSTSNCAYAFDKKKGNAQESKNCSVSLSDSKDHLSICKGNHLPFSRTFERKNQNNQGDNICDLAGGQETSEDSGIEILRAFSSNSSNSDRFTPVPSCGSSLVSYSSEPEGDRGSECGSESSEKSRLRNEPESRGQCSSNCWKSRKIYERSRTCRKLKNCDGEATSESCSETSSTHEATAPDQSTRSADSKRSASSRLQGAKKCESSKSSVLFRPESSIRNSFDKISVKSHSILRSSSTAGRIGSSSKCFSSSKGIKSAGAGKCESGRRSSLQKIQSAGSSRVSTVADPFRKSLNSVSCIMSCTFGGEGGGGISNSCEGKSDALDKYGTLPRRAKKKLGESLDVSVMQASYSRSHSVTREPSLNRAATLRRQQSKEKENASNCKSLPPYPRPRRGTGKITIYHEVSVQTVITGEDMNSPSGGVSVRDRRLDSYLQKENKAIQTEGKEKLKEFEDVCSKQSEELQAARRDVEKLKSEKENMELRICKLLGFSDSMQTESRENGLDELEKHFQTVGFTVIKQQEELSELRHYKLIANRDLEKSLAAQKNLLQQQQEIEEEYSELQEFLQAEKTALSESLIDTEEELKRLRDEVSRNESLLIQQQEECKHLVRICEQRRQENLSLEAKLSGLDQRSRDVLVQQGAAVSAAAVALSGLGARLDTLVEQLSASCNISEQDLEDVIYHNEMYRKSADSSPDDVHSQPPWADISTQQQSFIQIILRAIRNAAQSPFVSRNKHLIPRKLSESFLYPETESLLSFEHCLEENSLTNLTDYDGGFAQLEDNKHEKKESNMTRTDGKSGYELTRSDSLQNLSEAILNRQMTEQNERSVGLDQIIPIEVNTLVGQIVDVDNLVTKLLKVIKFIQGGCGQQIDKLEEERVNLKDELRQEKLCRRETENNLRKVQVELTDARSQLNSKISQLEEAKALCSDNQRIAVGETQKRFALIDATLEVLNSAQDIVEQCPQLARLQHELKDCNYQRMQGGDVNANPENGHFENMKCNGAVLTTAV